MSLIFFTIVAKIRKQMPENKGNFSLILYFCHFILRSIAV